jgi:hypothetical protein
MLRHPPSDLRGQNGFLVDTAERAERIVQVIKDPKL